MAKGYQSCATGCPFSSPLFSRESVSRVQPDKPSKSYCLLYWFLCLTISYAVAGRESVAIFLLVEAARQAFRESYCLLYWFICPTISYVVAGRESVAIFLLVEAARQALRKSYCLLCIGLFVRRFRTSWQAVRVLLFFCW